MDNKFLLNQISKEPLFVIDKSIPLDSYMECDLSKKNSSISHIDMSSPNQFQEYFDQLLKKHNKKVLFGGYLEERSLYDTSEGFNDSNEKRTIHIGLDLWVNSGTNVLAPIDGIVHSFKDNNVKGDYGPTIILKHQIQNLQFYTLYGHLSRASLEKQTIGKSYKQNEIIGQLGEPSENVNYAPHLHFQIIFDLEGNQGDYPGVSSDTLLDFYKSNCPDPNLLLKLK